MGMLIASKRFEFAASHYYRHPLWAEAENTAAFGNDARGPYGHGHNFVMYAGFTGPLDPETGMIVELSHVKKDVLSQVLQRYDHYVLNSLPAFAKILPTPENIALVLLSEVQPVFSQRVYRPAHVHLIESSRSAATAYADGRVERHWEQPLGHARFFDFWGSGVVSLGITFTGIPDPETGMIVSDSVVSEGLQQLAMQVSHMSFASGDAVLSHVTAQLAILGMSYDRAVLKTPQGNFSVDTHGPAYTVSGAYTATHRLDNPQFTRLENESCFGKCHRPHGHTFDVDITVLTDRALSEVADCLALLLSEWDYQALDLHPDFADRRCTTEHMVHVLAAKWERRGVGTLKRICLHETPNNRFSLRL
jgi:6-pyruvoyltetrahydropterin/6-carboxytetrahydropterin synthase